MGAAPHDPGFSPAELRTLASVLDELVPPHPAARLPGAGEAGLAPAIAAALGEQPELRAAVVEALAAVDERAHARGAPGFADLAPAERGDAMRESGARNPLDLVGLIFLTLTTYYRTARVLEALGHEARPPHPQGYVVAPTDFSVLDPVRARPRVYREP